MTWHKDRPSTVNFPQEYDVCPICGKAEMFEMLNSVRIKGVGPDNWVEYEVIGLSTLHRDRSVCWRATGQSDHADQPA